jgi:hypothetical protein
MHTHTHTPVCEQEDVIALWNQGVHANREVTVSRPDIIIKNKKENTCILMDEAIPAAKNVIQKEAEKELKYKSLCMVVPPMWDMKSVSVLVIIGATKIVTKGLKQTLDAIPQKYSVDHCKRQLYLEHDS